MLNRIYHYTSADTLEKILRNQAIRFNRLDCVDDVQECSVSSYAKYVFISCWTESEEENIPLWKMYTNDVTQGVRISLPRDMFKTYPVISSKYLKSQMTKDIIPEVVQEQADYFVVPVDFENDEKYENFFRHVEYVRNPNIAVGDIASKTTNGYNTLAINRLGRYKSKCWEFQNEVRFALTIFPFNPMKIASLPNAQKLIADAIFQMKELSFNDYYLHLKSDILDDLVITLSPNISNLNRQKVKCIVDKYAPGAIVNESCFLGKVNLK